MTRTPGKVRHAGKALGADNDEIYPASSVCHERNTAASKRSK